MVSNSGSSYLCLPVIVLDMHLLCCWNIFYISSVLISVWRWKKRKIENCILFYGFQEMTVWWVISEGFTGPWMANGENNYIWWPIWVMKFSSNLEKPRRDCCSPSDVSILCIHFIIREFHTYLYMCEIMYVWILVRFLPIASSYSFSTEKLLLPRKSSFYFHDLLCFSPTYLP